MPTYTGRLGGFGNQSTLGTPSATFLLLKAGISDPTQAQFAATYYLLETQKLNRGQLIHVNGQDKAVGSVRVIAMTSASAASPSPFESAVVFRATNATKASKPAGSTRKRSAKKRTNKRG